MDSKGNISSMETLIGQMGADHYGDTHELMNKQSQFKWSIYSGIQFAVIDGV